MILTNYPKGIKKAEALLKKDISTYIAGKKEWFDYIFIFSPDKESLYYNNSYADDLLYLGRTISMPKKCRTILESLLKVKETRETEYVKVVACNFSRVDINFLNNNLHIEVVAIINSFHISQFMKI